MTAAVIILGALLIGAGCYAVGVVTSERVLARLMPAEGAHSIPAGEVDRAFAGRTHHAAPPFAIEPPRTRRADLPVAPARTTGPQPWVTAPFAAVPGEPDDRDLYHGSYQAEHGDYGTRPVAEVLAAEQRAEVAW